MKHQEYLPTFVPSISQPTMLPTPSTLTTVLSRPAKRARLGHRHGITGAERRELRQYWANVPADAKPTQEEIPDDDLDPVVPIRPAEALAAIQTLKDWEEQQDDSSHKVVRQLKDIEKRVKVLQISHLQQCTLDSYFTQPIGVHP